jgi:hypothetical protein
MGTASQFAPGATTVAAAVPRREAFSYSLSTLMLIVTLAAACFGLLAVLPGLGVIVCILMVPVLIRTAMVVRRREDAGGTVSPAEKVALMATSFAATIVLITVVGFAAFCCACTVCVTAFGVLEGEPEALGFVAVAAAGAAIALPVSVMLIKWSRWRFKRDVEGPRK